MTKNNCIVSQVHIPPYDPQKKILDLTIRHTRQNNPSTYLVLVGHGEAPLKTTTEVCDHIIWEPGYPQDSGGTIIGMPAQYKSVSKGIEHAASQGYDYCIKTRGDSLIDKEGIVSHMASVLEDESKKIVLTQQTGNSLYKFGDCLMYGEMPLLQEIWNSENPPFHADGLRHTGASFVKYFRGNHPPQDYRAGVVLAEGLDWNGLLRKYAAFRDIFNLGFVDLRWNYHAIASRGWERTSEEIMSGDFDLFHYLWGQSNGWHVFDRSGKLVSKAGICSWIYTEEEFYKT